MSTIISSHTQRTINILEQWNFHTEAELMEQATRDQDQALLLGGFRLAQMLGEHSGSAPTYMNADEVTAWNHGGDEHRRTVARIALRRLAR
jgi:hypothetical protein